MTNREKWSVDFHTHSSYSDGFHPPEEVVSMAARHGLKALAITDHDTMDGIPAAVTAGQRLGVEVVPGVEISAIFRGEEIHLLGYYPSLSGRLPLFLKLMKKERFRRAGRILRRLNRLGINLSREEITGESYPAPPGRLHFARLMLKRRAVSSIEEAFDRFLGEGGAAYFSRQLFPAERALQILHQSRAVSVLAHPGLIKRSPVEELLSLGVRGLEVFYPEHSYSDQHLFFQLARERKLLITGGSDFHGGPQNQVNRPGYISVGYHHLQQLQQTAGSRQLGFKHNL